MSGSPSTFSDQSFHRLIAEARAFDGTPPFSDGSLIEYAQGKRQLLWIEDAAAALTNGTSAEFVVAPQSRRQGFGAAMLERLLGSSPGQLLLWAHGDHPGARALARKSGFVPVRTLLHLGRYLPRPVAADPADAARPADVRELPEIADSPISHSAPAQAPAETGNSALEPFRPGVDEEEWLALNARAFASHPEQGSMSIADLEATMREPWFDASDFLLLRDDAGALVAYAWMKIEGELGEFYVVGVDPGRQGRGLGRELVAAGLAHLESRGIHKAHLYVEGDSVAALKLYRSTGFTEQSVDVQYALATDPRSE